VEDAAEARFRIAMLVESAVLLDLAYGPLAGLCWSGTALLLAASLGADFESDDQG
jgi:hypothetical protein